MAATVDNGQVLITFNYTGSASDGVQNTDAITVLGKFLPVNTDGINLTDTLAVKFTYHHTASDGASLTDSVTGGIRLSLPPLTA